MLLNVAPGVVMVAIAVVGVVILVYFLRHDKR